jgi:mRNA interferase MazF
VVISQGDVHWADFGLPIGSQPGYRRPAVVVQCDVFNRSRIATVVCVPLTTNPRRADAPGNVPLAAEYTGLPQDSVAIVSQLTTLDKTALLGPVGKLPASKLDLVLSGIEVVLGR